MPFSHTFSLVALIQERGEVTKQRATRTLDMQLVTCLHNIMTSRGDWKQSTGMVTRALVCGEADALELAQAKAKIS